jgi:hypothetical protein
MKWWKAGDEWRRGVRLLLRLDLTLRCGGLQKVRREAEFPTYMTLGCGMSSKAHV